VALPDAEITARNWALAQSSIASIVGTSIATRLPSSPTFPFLTVFRLGGTLNETGAEIDEPFLQWDAYAASGENAPDYGTAYDLAIAVALAAQNFTGVVVNPGIDAHVYLFELLDGPRRLEEPETGWGRYQVDMNMVIRSVP
jgi:hypothetical protein